MCLLTVIYSILWSGVDPNEKTSVSDLNNKSDGRRSEVENLSTRRENNVGEKE